MRTSLFRRAVSLLLCAACSFSLCLPLLPAFLLSASAEDEAEAWVTPGALVDFSTHDAIDRVNGQYHLSVDLAGGAMQIRFEDTGGGSCFDPYMNLPVPEGVDIAKNHILVMLVKTDLVSKRGEIRFRTGSTGEHYPCQPFRYQATDDWQLITVDLTNKSTVLYVPGGTSFTGSITNLRLDMFDNDCSPSTQYFIKALALYDNAEDAATFADYVTLAERQAAEEEKKPDVDYASFWRGEAFALPPLPSRMRWVSYGFRDASPIDRLLRQGYGGVVSNVMMDATYLKDPAQFATLAEVYRYADSLGMKSWIYDEYQWPSGKAFGMVLEGHDELESTGIRHLTFKGSGGTASYTVSGKEIMLMDAVLTDADGSRRAAIAADKRSASADASGAWTLDVYVLQKLYDGVENRNDFTTLRPVDLLNPAATSRFLTLTHEAYKKQMGSAFSLVEAFFTDEPQLGNRKMLRCAVWTEGFAEKFRAVYGYELNIPSIFGGDSDEDRLCRIHYYQLVASLFRESYFKQISDWCAANGTLSSGHLLFEENMNDHIETYGGDFLQVVGAMDCPGVDILWVTPSRLLSRTNIGNAVGIRYVVSAAKNAGKSGVMVEFNPDAAGALSREDPLGECIGGVSVTRLLGTTVYNVINPQLNLSESQSVKLNEYVGRLNSLLDGAREVGEVAVFYPIAAVQALHDADTGHGSETAAKGDKADELDERYQTLLLNLLSYQHLYTVLDDESIRASVITADGHLCVGSGAYSTVILPMAQYISLEALQKLVTLTKAGGTVIFYGQKPAHGLRAGEDEAIAALMEQLSDMPTYAVTSRSLPRDLSQYVKRTMLLDADSKTRPDILMGDFETDDHDITCVVNVGETHDVTLTYADGYTGRVSVYYPINGDIRTEEMTDGRLTLTVKTNHALLIVREDDNRTERTPYVPEEETQPDTRPETSPVTQAPAGNETSPAEGLTETTPETPASGCRSTIAALPLLPAALLLLRRRKDD